MSGTWPEVPGFTRCSYPANQVILLRGTGPRFFHGALPGCSISAQPGGRRVRRVEEWWDGAGAGITDGTRAGRPLRTGDAVLAWR